VIQQLIGRIARALDAHKIPYMIIGGQAVLMHGRPRLTQDVDITLGVDTDRFKQVYACAQGLKLRPLRPDPERFSEIVEAVRDAGYATASNELQEGYAAVAAPILNAAGAVCGALSIGGPVGRLDAGRLKQLGLRLKEVAGEIHAPD